MKITDLATYLVPPRWLFLKVQTDAGIVGWGEPVIEGRAATVAAAVEELGDYLIGQDPLRIEDSSAQQTLGPEGRVAVDFHGRLSPATARQLCQLLEPLRPLFVEEPTVPELPGELGRLCDSTTIPIATGERLYSRWDFKNVLEAGIAVAQPDPSHAGGISECRRIAAMAEAHGVMMAPHCPLGPIALAACLQLDFATPNTLIQECSLGIHYNVGSDLLDYLLDTTPLAVTKGMVSRPTRPGLGIEVDEEAVRHAARSGHRWRSPVWRHADESLAEW